MNVVLFLFARAAAPPVRSAGRRRLVLSRREDLVTEAAARELAPRAVRSAPPRLASDEYSMRMYLEYAGNSRFLRTRGGREMWDEKPKL